MTIQRTNRLAGITGLVFLSACDGGGGDHFRLPDAQPLATATTMQATASKDGVNLNWQAVAGVASYAVYRCPVPAGVTDSLCDSTPANVCGAPVSRTTSTFFTDIPPIKAPDQAYCYRLSSCTDATGQVCGPVVASVASAQRVAAPVRQVSAVIGDDGREVISGLTTSLHAFPNGATGNIFWSWAQESGPKVTLVGANTPDLTFAAPFVTVNTLLSFELRVSDDNGPGSPSKVAVTVVPAGNVIVKADAASRQVQAGHEVRLHARGTAPGLSYSWRQISPAIPQVTLAGADTDNPSFTAPAIAGDTVLRFEVTATDPISGRSASARAGVEIVSGVPSPQGALPVPLQLSQPLQLPQQTTTTMPLPVPSLRIPPQSLLLLAAPEQVATGGTSVQLGLGASGGVEPYQWTWTQTSGPAAVLLDANQAVATVQVPVVTTSQALTFRATLTDANGTVRTAQAVVQATVPPQPGTGTAPTPLASLPTVFAFTNEPVKIDVPLTGLAIVQNSGPVLQTGVAQAATASVITLTAPTIRDNSAPASLVATGTDAIGQRKAYFIPVIIQLAPGQMAALTEPPQIPLPAQVLVPRQDDPLIIISGNSVSADEGRIGAGIGFAARGGRGRASYSYRLDYIPAAGGPDLGFTGVAAQSKTFDIPLVDRPTDLNFLFQVTDGVQRAMKAYTVRINDRAPTETVGTLTPITASSSHAVTISMPVPRGGFPYTDGTPPYRYSIVQTDGAALVIPPLELNGGPGNFGFNAPTLVVGAPAAVLVFEVTATDRSGSAVKVIQQVTVTAPPPPVASAPPPVASIVSPSIVTLGAFTNNFAPLSLQAKVVGGRAPYTYQWTVQRNYTPAPATAPSDLTGTGQNPGILIPDVDFTQVDRAELVVRLLVTDADNRTANAVADSPVLLQSRATYPGGEMLLCGDVQSRKPCTDLDLVLAMTSRCPDTQPFGLNSIYIDGQAVTEYRRCVDANVAYDLWYVKTRPLGDVCLNFDPSGLTPQTPPFECHLACAGNGCNIDTNPPADTLLKPGPNGTMTNDAGTALNP